MTEMAISWRCGKCKKIYSSLLPLEPVKAVDSDTNPKEQHGFVSKCTCGYVFHKDKWQLKNVFKIRKRNFFGHHYDLAEVRVSTIDLELQHFRFWYETMVFVGWSRIRNLECHFQERYKTKREAERRHNKIVDKLQDGNYDIVPAKVYGTFWDKLKESLFYKKQELVF